MYLDIMKNGLFLIWCSRIILSRRSPAAFTDFGNRHTIYNLLSRHLVFASIVWCSNSISCTNENDSCDKFQKITQAWLLGMERPCFVFARIHSRRSPNNNNESPQMSHIPVLSAIDQRRSPIGNDRPPIGSLVAILRLPRAHGPRVRLSHYLQEPHRDFLF